MSVVRATSIGLVWMFCVTSFAQTQDNLLAEAEQGLEDALLATRRFNAFLQQTLDLSRELGHIVQALENVRNNCEQSTLETRQQARQIESFMGTELAACVERLQLAQIQACGPEPNTGVLQSRVLALAQSCQTLKDEQTRRFSEMLTKARQLMKPASADELQLIQQRDSMKMKLDRVQRGTNAARTRLQRTLQSLDTKLLIAEQNPLAVGERLDEIRRAGKRLLPSALPEIRINLQKSTSQSGCAGVALDNLAIVSQPGILELVGNLVDQAGKCGVKVSEQRPEANNNASNSGEAFDLWSDPGLPGSEKVPVESSAISEQRLTIPGGTSSATASTTMIKGYGTSKREGNSKKGNDGENSRQNNVNNQGAQQKSKREEEIAQDYADPPS